MRHGVRNGAVPVVSVLGIELATTFLGAVVVEQVFSLPGLGSMLLLAIQQRDYPNVQGVLLVSTLLVLIVGFLADLAAARHRPPTAREPSVSVAAAEARPAARRLALWLGLLLVGIHVAAALVSFVWTPYALSDMGGGRLEPPGWAHPAGTDRLGRDLLTQLMIGSRIALVVGSGAVAIGALIGVTAGVLAAFATRFLDDALAAAFDILIAFPTLLHRDAGRRGERAGVALDRDPGARASGCRRSSGG